MCWREYIYICSCETLHFGPTLKKQTPCKIVLMFFSSLFVEWWKLNFVLVLTFRILKQIFSLNRLTGHCPKVIMFLFCFTVASYSAVLCSPQFPIYCSFKSSPYIAVSSSLPHIGLIRLKEDGRTGFFWGLAGRAAQRDFPREKPMEILRSSPASPRKTLSFLTLLLRFTFNFQ